MSFRVLSEQKRLGFLLSAGKRRDPQSVLCQILQADVSCLLLFSAFLFAVPSVAVVDEQKRGGCTAAAAISKERDCDSDNDECILAKGVYAKSRSFSLYYVTRTLARRAPDVQLEAF